MNTTILLVRHAVTEWHGLSRVLGRNDIPLNEEGEKQARTLAAACEDLPIARVVSSPLSRATRTAEALAKRRDLSVEVDPRFSDFDVGEWAGLTYEEIGARDDFQRFQDDPLGVTPPGGESLGQAARRAVEAAGELRRSAGDGVGVAIVTHSDIVRLLLAYYLGMSPAYFARFRVDVASATVIAFSGARARVTAVNWSPALRDIAFHGIQEK